jgi:hypothetical protein
VGGQRGIAAHLPAALQNEIDALLPGAGEIVECRFRPEWSRGLRAAVGQMRGERGISGTSCRRVEIGGQHDRQAPGQRGQPRRDQPGAFHAGGFVFHVAVGEMRVDHQEAGAGTLPALQHGPLHHARQRGAPAQAARDGGGGRKPEHPVADQPQTVGAIENAHVFVGMAAKAIRAEPAPVRQVAHHGIALALEQFLRADDIGIGGADRGQEHRLALWPGVEAIIRRRPAHVEAHHPQRPGRAGRHGHRGLGGQGRNSGQGKAQAKSVPVNERAKGGHAGAFGVFDEVSMTIGMILGNRK